TSCPAGTGIFPSSYDTTTCADGNFTLCFPDLAPGTYYYGLAATNNNPGPYTMTVSAEVCVPDEAVNDDCTAAIELTVNTTCIDQYFTNACATQSLPAVTCGTFTGNASDDVWYSFEATATEITIGGAPRGNMDVVLELFEGSCGNLTSIGCSDVNGSGASEDLVATSLTVDDTYYLRIYDFRPQFAYGEPGFDLCVVEGGSSGVGLSEVNTARTGTLFPNPTKGAFTITVGERAAQVDYTITDATGRMVLQQRAQVSNGRIAIDATGVLSAGQYAVRLNDGSSTTTHRLVVN
ncbi:MAG TPA: T9SS type A sorting domain-containing protein, partial [Flavobacteriales bacterium]|nr:T9SS type A sorting domain-containing protein [Flavobacteriales bacterium]